MGPSIDPWRTNEIQTHFRHIVEIHFNQFSS